MASQKLSQIGQSVTPPLLTDTVVGVSAQNQDTRYSLAQVQATIAAAIGATPFGWKNIKTDFGAIGNGVADDSGAFFAFQTYAQAQTTGVVLVVPPGVYQMHSAQGFYAGISDLTIIAYGATFSSFDRGGVIFQAPLGTQSARINSTAIGNTSVTLQTPAQNTIFTVGNWVIISSLDMQGAASYPPNWYQFEFRQITAINAGTGVISLDNRLRYAHLSTYPSPSAGNSSYDTGGPASIFNIKQDWAQTLRVYGATIQGTGQNLTARDLKFTDCTFTNTSFNIAPTVSEHIVFEDCIFSGNVSVEPDKDITLLEFERCVFRLPIILQSASIDNAIFASCDLQSPLLGTTAKSIEIRNCHVASLQIGQFGIGPSGKLILENNRIDAFQATNENVVPVGDVTFSNGTFSMAISSPNTFEFFPFAIPGNQLFFNGTGLGEANWGFPFTVTNVRQDVTNYYADTTLKAIPSYSIAPPDSGTVTPANLVPHPAPRFTAKNNNGDQLAVDMSKQVGEQPLYSYGRRLLTGNLNAGWPSAQIIAWGTLVKIRINVIQAYTGAQSALNLFFTAQSGTFYLDTTTTPGTGIWTRWTPSINLKIAGQRVITPGSVTGTQTGDSIVTPGAWWMVAFLPFFDADISGDTRDKWPIVDMEVFTDQGVNAIPAMFVGPTLVTQ